MSQLPERYRAAIAPVIDKARQLLEQGEALARRQLARGALFGEPLGACALMEPGAFETQPFENRVGHGASGRAPCSGGETGFRVAAFALPSAASRGGEGEAAKGVPQGLPAPGRRTPY